MATTKKAAKKVKGPLTLEQRIDRIEKDFRHLGAKLRTHGIHLEPETDTETELEQQDEE